MSSKAYDLFQKTHDSRGQKYLNRAYYRSFTLNVFSGNTESLRNALKEFTNTDDHIKIFLDKNREEEMAIFREVARQFHNFLYQRP
jgi:type II secretory pathway predicted ATPase ExeA